MEVKPIGIVHTDFKDSSGVPIQPAFAKGSKGTVEIFEQYSAGLKDLDGFERIWLLCWFDRASEFKLEVKPYMDDKLHGLFTTRAPSRPNPIGLSCVRLLSVEGRILHVADVDILDGTPLLDIKPYTSRFDCFETKRNGWLDTIQDSNKKSDNRFYMNKKESGGVK